MQVLRLISTYKQFHLCNAKHERQGRKQASCGIDSLLRFLFFCCRSHGGRTCLLVVDVEVDVEQVPESKQRAQSQCFAPFWCTRTIHFRLLLCCCCLHSCPWVCCFSFPCWFCSSSCCCRRSGFHHILLSRSSAAATAQEIESDHLQVGITRHKRGPVLRLLQHRCCFPAAADPSGHDHPHPLRHPAGLATGSIAKHPTRRLRRRDSSHRLHARPALHAGMQIS